LTKLEFIGLEGNAFNDKTFELLASMPSLRHIFLHNVTLNKDSLPHFVKMQQLKYLQLGHRPGLSPDELKTLVEQMPNCRVSGGGI